MIDSVDKKLDIFDLICHVAYDRPPLTRRERANNVIKRDYFTKYGEQAREVLEALVFINTPTKESRILRAWTCMNVKILFTNIGSRLTDRQGYIWRAGPIHCRS